MSGEADQVLWRGVRPVEGIRGVWPARNVVRVSASNFQAGSGITIIYTVPVGKKLFMSGSSLHSLSTADGQKVGRMGVRESDDTFRFWVLYHYFIIKAAYNTTLYLSPALEVEAGEDVYVESNDAIVTARGTFHGWLEDA